MPKDIPSDQTIEVLETGQHIVIPAGAGFWRRLFAFFSLLVLQFFPNIITASQDTTILSSVETQKQNWHVQNTVIVQGDPGFPAKYSGPSSLNSSGEIRETVSLDFFAGMRLWRGAEAHADLLSWQGFGLSQTYGIEDFPNGDAYKAGTQIPNLTFARLFIRQTFAFGGEQEEIEDAPLALAGTEDISRLTFTIGRFSPLDILDNNSYAHDQHTQFMNWAMMGNIVFDYGENTIGYSTGFALELDQPKWALRYTFFQMPRDKNGFTGDDQILTLPTRGAYGPFLHSWSMAAEYEQRYGIGAHPGAIRFLAWLDEANMALYEDARAFLLANGANADISVVRSFHHKYGFGLNWEQEVSKNFGIFSRLGWCDGKEETWTFTDVDYSASLGVSIKGEAWNRFGDAFGLAIIAGGASQANQGFLQAGGRDMLSGDGALNYGWEKVLETYYNCNIWKAIYITLDYQFIINPAFNRDRGPVSVFGGRLHWEF